MTSRWRHASQKNWPWRWANCDQWRVVCGRTGDPPTPCIDQKSIGRKITTSTGPFFVLKSYCRRFEEYYGAAKNLQTAAYCYTLWHHVLHCGSVDIKHYEYGTYKGIAVPQQSRLLTIRIPVIVSYDCRCAGLAQQSMIKWSRSWRRHRISDSVKRDSARMTDTWSVEKTVTRTDRKSFNSKPSVIDSVHTGINRRTVIKHRIQLNANSHNSRML